MLGTTVEDVSIIRPENSEERERWKLTLRKHDPVRKVDIWWEEDFDAVVLANGHYSVPFVRPLHHHLLSRPFLAPFPLTAKQIPEVDGLATYLETFPGRVVHSKTYRSPLLYQNKRVLVIGNSASGHDVASELVSTATLPVYQSRRSASRWDGDSPPAGQEWKPVISSFISSGAHAGRIVFSDASYLDKDDIDTVIYCTGYKASFPFWNSAKNGRELFDYDKNKLDGIYQHTFFRAWPHSLGIVGMPRVLTFRSFEYQAIVLARVFSGREARTLPGAEEMQRWERELEEWKRAQGKKFHDIEWETGETREWLGALFRVAGLGGLMGEGRVPPVLDEELVWAVEHLRKYPEPGKGEDGGDGGGEDGEEEKEGSVGLGGESAVEGKDGVGVEWILVHRNRVPEGKKKDLLAFI